MRSFLVIVCFSLLALGVKTEDLSGVKITLATDPCPKGWNYVSQLDQCYIIPDLFLNRDDAQAYCQNVTGGDLVSVYSQYEYDTLLQYTRSKSYSLLYPFWIGLQPDTWYPYWQWEDNRSPNFTKWINDTKPDQKTNPCIAWKTINADGWTPMNCKYAQPFICKQHSQNCPTITVNGTTGTLTSPNYPGEYDLNANCIYHINVPSGYVVKLIFDVIDMDYLADLFIYDGPSINSDKLGDIFEDYYYSWWFDGIYTSTETAMTLQFQTASWMYTHATGWTAHFLNVTAPTPTYINGTDGALTSPNYPNNYTDKDTSYFKFVAPSNHRIVITIWDFVTEKYYDWLQIYDSQFVNDGKPILDWDGDHTADMPKIITTTSNFASLIWHTDQVKSYRGFNMTWTSENYYG